MAFIDLHLHSTCSDGTLGPGELVARAQQLGLDSIAITDHDTMAGIPEAMAQGTAHQVEVIAGIEISAWHDNRAVHILGFGVQHDHAPLLASLKNIQEARHARNAAILDKLCRLGIETNHEELRGLAGDQIGRPHIARLLVRKGVVFSQSDAFAQFLGKGGKAYVARQQFPAVRAIRIINEAGGLAFLAHPGSLAPTPSTIRPLLDSLQAAGLAGIEVYHPSHSTKTAAALRNQAIALGLLQSGGTDFHGFPTWPELLARLRSSFTNAGNALALIKKQLGDSTVVAAPDLPARKGAPGP